MSSGDPFSDPSLKQAIVREADRLEVDPALAASVQSLFANAETPAPLPFPRTRYLVAAAAVIVAGLSVAFFAMRSADPDWDAEYAMSEARLWPAMASLYQSHPVAPPATGPAGGLGIDDPRYVLLGVRQERLDGEIPCTVRDYRRDDGASLALISLPAASLLRNPDDADEDGERYDERVGTVRVVGGVKDGVWVCVAAPAAAPDDLFNDALARVRAAE